MKRTFAAGLLQRRECTLPTWRGWLALLVVAGIAGVIAVRLACHFLTVETAEPGGVLVVEGWISPGDAQQALTEFHKGSYTALYVTGGPIEAESPLASFGSYAELTADVLRRLGADPAMLHAVPGPKVAKDRTYSTAVALKKALHDSGVPAASLNVVTAGVHARRSRLLYEKAFGSGTRVGTIALEEHEFDPDRWWTTSAGFRAVTSELIAYFYARFLFKPTE
jgi:hypothetical protein